MTAKRDGAGRSSTGRQFAAAAASRFIASSGDGPASCPRRAEASADGRLPLDLSYFFFTSTPALPEETLLACTANWYVVDCVGGVKPISVPGSYLIDMM